MATPGNEPIITGAFDWLFGSVGGWGRLFAVARELRRIDGERLDVMLEAPAGDPDPLSPEDAIRVRNLAEMLKNL